MEHISTLIAQTPLISPDVTQTEILPLVERFAWNYRCYTPTHERALNAAKRFASAAIRREAPRWLTLLGPSGVGKTHLLRQTLKLCGRLIEWKGWPRQLTTARIIPSRDLDVYTAARDYAENFDIAFIEDIMAGDKGAGAVKRDRIADLLQLRSRKFTLIDGNFAGVGDVADHFDGRIASRLKRDDSECITFPVTTPDFSTLQP